VTQSAGAVDPPVIELRDVSKTFGEVRSLSGVNFAVNRGEIVGLLGDNGAGKSTLVKIVMGFYRPDSGGEIHFHGRRIDDWSVARARSLGIETVYQERALSEKQPIWRNMFMGREPRTRWGLIDVKRMRSESARLMSEHMGFTSAAVHPDNVVTTMSGGEKQGVAITRALYFDAELVILDEPFRGLDREKRRRLLGCARELWRDCTLLCITHDIEETRDFDRVLVVEQGRVAEDGTPEELYASSGSRYGELLEAEAQTRSGLWSGSIWRRIRIHSGRIVEEMPEPMAQPVPETEVA